MLHSRVLHTWYQLESEQGWRRQRHFKKSAKRTTDSLRFARMRTSEIRVHLRLSVVPFFRASPSASGHLDREMHERNAKGAKRCGCLSRRFASFAFQTPRPDPSTRLPGRGIPRIAASHAAHRAMDCGVGVGHVWGNAIAPTCGGAALNEFAQAARKF